MAKVRITEDEMFPTLVVISGDDIDGHEEEIFQVPGNIAAGYFAAHVSLAEMERSILRWLYVNKYKEAMQAIPNVMEKFERDAADRGCLDYYKSIRRVNGQD